MSVFWFLLLRPPIAVLCQRLDFHFLCCLVTMLNNSFRRTFFIYIYIHECVDDHEYLGVSISHDLCWEKHCNKITKKTIETLELLHHTLSPCSKEVKSRA